MPVRPAGEVAVVTLLAAGGAAVAGAVAGVVVDRVAGRYPWPAGARLPALAGPGAAAVGHRVLAAATALLLVLVVARFGVSWPVPAFGLLAVAAVLLTVIDVQHHRLPNRVVLPAVGAGAVLLTVAAVTERDGAALARAVLGAGVLFAAFLVLALVSPGGGLGMGDVKLAALVGLFLGWLGWPVLLAGALLGFVAQAVLAGALLAARRVRRDGQLPFGPAMLRGAAVAIGWPHW